MEWLSADLERGQSVLVLIAIVITVVIIWLGVVFLGRKGLVVTIAVAFTWLMLSAMVIPSFIPARSRSCLNACTNNLKEIRAAKAAWAKAEHKLPTEVPTEEILYGTYGTNGFLRHRLECPGGGKYTIGAVGENPSCNLADKGHKLE